MKLITWNIQWGCGMDGRVDFDRIVATARSLADFDVLCLQEVADGFTDLAGSAGENQFHEIACRLPGYTAVEGVGLFWHLIDLVWIYLFPLLYLVS